MNLNTGYYDKGLVVKDRRLVVNHYIKNNLVTDIMSVIAILIDYSQYVKYVKNLKILI